MVSTSENPVVIGQSRPEPTTSLAKAIAVARSTRRQSAEVKGCRSCIAVNRRFDSDAKPAVLSVLILRLLADRESYGYELVQRLHDVGLAGISDGSVYPALARLEREGLIVPRLVASTSGPARKYHRPTPDGYAALRDLTGSWLALADMVTPVVSAAVPARPVAASEEN